VKSVIEIYQSSVLENMGFIIQYVIFVDIQIKTVDIKNIQNVKQLQQEEYNDTKDEK
jgi:hypothetical protein